MYKYLHETTENLFAVVCRFGIGETYARTEQCRPGRPFELQQIVQIISTKYEHLQ